MPNQYTLDDEFELDPIRLEQRYQHFCKHRHEISNFMPDYGISLFKDRVFDGRLFEINNGDNNNNG